MRKIQSSPTREIKNFWQRDAHTEGTEKQREGIKSKEIPGVMRLQRYTCLYATQRNTSVKEKRGEEKETEL